MISIVSKLLFTSHFCGIALWPFIVVREDRFLRDKIFMNHERVHLRQQAELLILPFYFWYFLEFLWRFLQYRNGHDAYRNISFEREAYAHEHDLTYLDHRPFWAFLRFL